MCFLRNFSIFSMTFSEFRDFRPSIKASGVILIPLLVTCCILQMADHGICNNFLPQTEVRNNDNASMS